MQHGVFRAYTAEMDFCRYVVISFFLLQDVVFFASCPAAPWPQFGEMLSWQFLSATKLGLNNDQLEMIAHRLFGEFRFCFLVSGSELNIHCTTLWCEIVIKY